MIDNAVFLMMRPVESHITTSIKDIVIWVAHNSDISMAGRAFGAKIVQSLLCMLAVAGQGSFNFLVNDDIDLYTCLGSALQDLVNPVSVAICRWPSQKLIALVWSL